MYNDNTMSFKIPLLVLKIIHHLTDNNFQAYVVGGAVRDLLTKTSTYDWDFTTNAKPEEIQKLFPESFYDNKFGTVGITAEKLVKQFKLRPQDDQPLAEKNYNYKSDNIKPGDILEITTFRSDHGYSDRRHPDKVVWGKTLKDDLERRDFTINALAIKITDYQLPITDYEIIDLFNGQQDLENKLIKAVGDPNKRFNEDALRMMRAIRLAAQLGFILEENTLKAIINHASLINHISQERIRDELLKILKSNFPSDGIRLLFTSGLLQHILPELINARDVQQVGHHTKDVWNHSLDSLAGCPSPNPIVRLAALLHDVGKPIAFRKLNGKITFYGHEVVGGRMVKNIAERLKLPTKDKEKLWLLVRYHMFTYEPKMTDKAIRRFIQRIGKENINEMMMLRIGDRKGGGSKATSWRLRELQERVGKLMYTPLSIADLKVDGNDVMKILNIKPGPKVGEILKKLFEEVMEDDKKNEREYLLKEIKRLKD